MRLQKTKNVLFIRHSESVANAGKKTSDPALIEITDLGKKQAIGIANAIEYPPELIITSPYLRTKQTALPTIKKYPNAKHEEWLVPALSGLKIAHIGMHILCPFPKE